MDGNQQAGRRTSASEAATQADGVEIAAATLRKRRRATTSSPSRTISDLVRLRLWQSVSISRCNESMVRGRRSLSCSGQNIKNNKKKAHGHSWFWIPNEHGFVNPVATSSRKRRRATTSSPSRTISDLGLRLWQSVSISRCNERMVCRRRSLSCSGQNIKEKNKKAHGHSWFWIPSEHSFANPAPTSSVNISNERLQVQDTQDLRTLSAPEPSCTVWLSSCASITTPDRLMKLEGSQFDAAMDYKILKFLLYYKMRAIYTIWNPLDQEVLCHVHSMLTGMLNIDTKTLKSRITELEQKVRYHMSGTQEIMENKELLLDVFDYVITGHDTTQVALCPDGAARRGYFRKRPGSESVGMESPDLLSLTSSESNKKPSLDNVIAKVSSLSLEDNYLCRAIDLLKEDAELREIIMALDHKHAKVYLMHVIQGLQPE